MKKKTKIIITTIIALLVCSIIGITIYANDYYEASDESILLYNEMIQESSYAYYEGNNNQAFIIYPGGKVDERAYSKLASLLHQEDYTVIIVSMPLKLSIINSNKAKSVIDDFPDIESWYIIGHSLGGTSASMFINKYPDLVEGIVFLGSYPYKDLSDFNGFSLTIHASNDLVLNTKKAEEAKDNYPTESHFETIDGGTHAGFGDYGIQKGDGNLSITIDKQHQLVIESILKIIQD